MGSSTEYLLRGCLPYGGEPVDVLVSGGRIAGWGPDMDKVSANIDSFDARGLVLLPGLVDLHTHLREPGNEEAETVASGSRAAAAGGYTDVFAMANTQPVVDSVERVEAVLEAAAAQSACRVHAVGAITVGLAGTELAPMAAMAQAGVRMFSDDGNCVDNAALMFQALRLGAQHGFLVAQHAQQGELAGTGQINAGPAATTTGLPPWPGVAEETIIARDVLLAAETGAALHVCHVSTARSVEVIRWAKAQGWPVSAEVTPHHLLLTDELAALGDPRYKVNPPLRSAADVGALRRALLDGTIDIVATDHAPHTLERKSGSWCSAAFGVTGLETALAVVAYVLAAIDRLDWKLVAHLMSETPARLGGIADSAGRPLAVGEPATYCLVDTRSQWTVAESEHYSKSSNTPFVGRVFPSAVAATAIDGRMTYVADAFAARPWCWWPSGRSW
ncbi:MAG: dihydroorotase [Lacisediminihabitans sp.]